MTIQSTLGKSILSKAADYYTLKEKLEGTEQAPIDEITHLLASYNTLVRDLANQGITLPNESQKYLAMLTKGLEKRVGELLPKTMPNDAEQLKIALQENKPQAKMPALEKVKRLSMYPEDKYGTMILEGIIEQLGNPEGFEISEGKTRLQHPKKSPLHYDSTLASISAITRGGDIICDLARYSVKNRYPIIEVYTPEEADFISATELVFNTASHFLYRFNIGLMPK